MDKSKQQIKKAETAINRKLMKEHSEQDIERFEWFVNPETADTYGWKFSIPWTGEVWLYTYHFSTSCVRIQKVK